MKINIKEMIKFILKTLLFVYLFFSIYNYTRDVFRDKFDSEALNIIADQPNGTYDVILAGSSHMQYSIQPAQLFGEYGISSCNVSTSAQSIPTTYYVVKEMIRRHDPELVVVDLFVLFYPEKAFSRARLHQAFDNFPLSLNKVEAIENLVDGDKAEFYLNYLLYHERWKNLTMWDYQFQNLKNEKYQLCTGLTQYENDFVPVPVTETAEIPEIPLYYLEKIVEVCKKTDTELLFTVIPYRADIDNNDTSALLQQRLYNTVEACAEDWGIDYLNGLHYLDEMGFDFRTDMNEYSHVNMSGARKVSNYYGAFFKENYQITDRLKDRSYRSWHEDYGKYLEQFEE